MSEIPKDKRSKQHPAPGRIHDAKLLVLGSYATEASSRHREIGLGWEGGSWNPRFRISPQDD